MCMCVCGYESMYLDIYLDTYLISISKISLLCYLLDLERLCHILLFKVLELLQRFLVCVCVCR